MQLFRNVLSFGPQQQPRASILITPNSTGEEKKTGNFAHLTMTRRQRNLDAEIWVDRMVNQLPIQVESIEPRGQLQR